MIFSCFSDIVSSPITHEIVFIKESLTLAEAYAVPDGFVIMSIHVNVVNIQLFIQVPN